MTTKYVVIVRKAGGMTKFWSGTRWVDEYPDSKFFTTKKALDEIKAKTLDTVGQLFLVENYGDEEEVITLQ